MFRSLSQKAAFRRFSAVVDKQSNKKGNYTMDQRYFDSLGHIKCTINDRKLLTVRGLRFRLEGEYLGEKDKRLVMTLVIMSEKGSESTRTFEKLLSHYFGGNCCEGGWSPNPNNPELAPFAKASGLSDQQILARIIGNSLVKCGAKLEVAYLDKGGGELEFLLTFPPGYSDCVRFPVSRLPVNSVFYDGKEAEKQFLQMCENEYLSQPVREV